MDVKRVHLALRHGKYTRAPSSEPLHLTGTCKRPQVSGEAFADMTAWATWYDHEDVQQVIAEPCTLATDVNTELWGPSPIVPQPIRPGG